MRIERFIKITDNITFDDLKKGKITPIEVYQAMIQTWLLNPAKALATDYPPDNNFRGLSLLALQLMFFLNHMGNS